MKNKDAPLTHYAVLGVAPSATLAQVTAAWRFVARATHPDGAHAGNIARYYMANTAQQVLRHGQRRAEYDAYLRLRQPQCARCGGYGVAVHHVTPMQVVPAVCAKCRGTGQC